MTFTIKQICNNGYYVSIEQKAESGAFYVSACQSFGNGLASYPLNSCTYSPSERAKAMATYSRYVRKYCK